MTIEFVGEHLGVSKLGHILMILSFVGAVFSSFSYFLQTKNELKGIANTSSFSFLSLGRLFFRAHTAAVVSLVALLFYMLLNHMYEFHYVFKHSNDIMPLKYILSCFWAGQEGSFLLWVICHVVLGNVLQLTARKWESAVMCVYMLVQAFLVSMLLGITLSGGWGVGVLVAVLCALPILLFSDKLTITETASYLLGAIVVGVFFGTMDLDSISIGSNPFVLLTRDSDALFNDPFFRNGAYVYDQNFQGQGLNPLLQNYWMTIHPPTLFVGFASTLIPFCYAVAGLWKKQLNEWMEPVLPWIYFGIMILGTGILMGGAWAYESLTFGGFWAWDPVENASLFPWLTFVGAAHVMLIQKKRGASSYITFLLTIFSFLFVVYSTYLTRSGVLSDTSVHSFASGASGQILFFLVFVYWLGGMVLLQQRLIRMIYTALALSLFWVTYNYGNFVAVNILFVLAVIGIFVWDYLKSFADGAKEEDNFSSREFWMFIGAIFLLLSCFQLIFNTSYPVINEIFGLDRVLHKTEIVSDYAVPQMIIATVVCLIMGISLFLKYKKTPWDSLKKPSVIQWLGSGVIVVLAIAMSDFSFGSSMATKILYPIFFFASLVTVIGNLWYFVVVLKMKFKNAGASLAHFGFGLLLLGAFVSTSQSEVISKNTSDADLEEESNGELLNAENLKIEIGDTLPMGEYWVTYRDKHQEGVNVYYNVDYFTEENGVKEYAFTLTPFIQTNKTFGRVAEPDTRHYLMNDLYTHLTSAISDTSTNISYEKFKKLRLEKGGELDYLGYKFSYREVQMHKTEELADSMVLIVDLVNPLGVEGIIEFPLVIQNSKIYPIPNANYDVGVAGEWLKPIPKENVFELYVAVEKQRPKDFIVLKAINFPLINLLWLGCVIMIIGTVLSIVKRIGDRRRQIAKES